MDYFFHRSARTQTAPFTKKKGKKGMWRNYSAIYLNIRILTNMCLFFFFSRQIRANPDYSLHKKYVAQLLGNNCHLLRKQKGVEYITGVCVELNPPKP